MKIQETPPLHLTYCLNVHRGEAWEDCAKAIREFALKVRDRVAPGQAFGLGLRLGKMAAEQLAGPRALAEFKEFLRREDLYVFTINGFPYGPFHQTAVKESVYAPDWRTEERRDYTILLAEILSELLPEGVPGSISTVPGSYKAWIRGEADERAMCGRLGEALRHLAAIRQRTGKEICLALEPEPDCYLETTDEAIAFVTGPMVRVVGDDALRHLGVCFDTSHLAVEFEDLAGSLRKLTRGGVPVGKIHLSSALRVKPVQKNLERLRGFCDPVYLHQVKARTAGGEVLSFADLPAALEGVAKMQAVEELRVHFHVPLYFQSHAGLDSTSSLLTGEFADLVRGGVSPHLEIETYTFDVLPAELKSPDITDSIAREYEWVIANCQLPIADCPLRNRDRF